MDDLPVTAPIITPEISALSPAQAGEALVKMNTALHPPSEPVPTDAQGARQLLDKLTKDAGWSKALLRGDPQVSKQFAELTALSAAGDDVADAAVGIVEPSEPRIEMTFNGELNRRDTATAVRGFLELGIEPEVIAQAMHGGVVSPQEHAAVAALLNALQSDPAWSRALLAGGYAERRTFTLLSIVLASEVSTA